MRVSGKELIKEQTIVNIHMKAKSHQKRMLRMKKMSAILISSNISSLKITSLSNFLDYRK